MATLGQVDMTWWTLGWVVGAAVVVAVVLLVGAIIWLAARVRGQARDIAGALEAARVNTVPLWRLRATRGAASEIVYDLRAGRTADDAGGGH